MKARRLVLPFHGLITVAGALIGLGLLAIGLTVWGLRSDAILVSARDSENIAHLIGDQISAAVEPLVDILDEIRERGAAVRIDDDEALRRHFGTEAVFQTLNDRLRRLPARAVIVVTDRDGVLLTSTRAWPPLAMSLADRPYVQHFRSAPASDLFISTPTESRVTGEPTLFFSKGIVDARGELVGVVAVGFEISYFERIWRAIASLAGRTFLLARSDGTILIRFPDPKRRTGERLPPDSVWYRVLAEGGGSYRGTGYFDPERRWISVSPLQRYPLVVNVATSENFVLEAWRRRSLLITVATLLAVASAVMLLRALIVQFRSLTRSEASLATASQELKRANARLDAALNNMSQGLCMFDRDERLVICNERYLRMYGLTPHDAPVGITLEELLARRVSSGNFMGDTREYRAWLRERLADGSRIYLQTELPDGRIVAVLNQPTPDGGWVATHEDVTERQRAARRIAHMARHDALTDLANRLLFSERMDEAFGRLRAVGEGFALFIFDLDLFKAVNDSFGHPVGDALLKAVAERLRKHVPEDCTVGRLGGDEFSILMPGAENRRREAARLAEMLLDVIGAPYEVDGSRIGIGISAGIALAPEDGDDTSTLLKNADLALYRAKAAGRHCYRFFEAEMDAQARMRHVLEIDLRNALARDELDVHYQVIVDVATRMPSGVEALVRWRHPVFGELSPDRFIPIAEDTGMIVTLGEWILRRACTDAMSWPPDIRVAVNLSPVQFRDPALVPTVRGILAAAGLPPQRLELEITESVLLQKHASIIAMLHELSDLGINIVLDDFGVGYSSLSYLRLFPFSKIKIDRGFVGEMTQRADCATIVSAVTSLAHALDMATTAEGVETWEQFRLVKAAGCSQAQGFLFSKPQPAEMIDFSRRGNGERSHG